VIDPVRKKRNGNTNKPEKKLAAIANSLSLFPNPFDFWRKEIGEEKRSWRRRVFMDANPQSWYDTTFGSSCVFCAAGRRGSLIGGASSGSDHYFPKQAVRLPVETKAYLEERKTFPVLIKFEHVII
jgi:hypothetical protein